MSWSKEIQEQMRNKIVDIYQSGKGFKAISKALGLHRTTVRAIIHKWRKLGTVVNLPRSGWPTKITPRAQRRLIQEVIKEPRTISKELQASLASIKVSVHDSTISQPIISTVKHGGGSVMVWGCFAVCDLKLKRTWVMQQDNDLKHTSKSTSEWLKKNKIKVLEWPSQSPDLNLIEMLWHDLKQSIHAQKPSNVAELKQFCKEEWAKIPPQRCERLIVSYHKRLIAVVAAKGGTTSY